MKRPAASFVVACLLLSAAAAWYALQRTASRDEPRLRVRQAEVLPSSEFLNAQASIDYYRERILKEPDVVRHYVELAQVYLQQARVTAEDTKYLPPARELLEEALRRNPAHYHARALRASLLNTLHHFEAAGLLARELLAEHPRDAFVHGVLVDALVELGDYEGAVAACDRLLEIRPGLPAYARASYLRELHGDSGGAIEAMTLAAGAGVPGRADRAWAVYQLGRLYLGAGEPEVARRLFEGLLEERPSDAFALGGLGHIKLLEGDYSASVALLRQAYEMAPSTAFLELLAEAYDGKGDGERHAETLALIRQRYRDAEASGEDVRLEYADFLADRDTLLQDALRLARLEYERRPNHLHALETYAWALYKNGRLQDAIPFIERALRLGTGDATVDYRAGMIYGAAGAVDKAREHLQRALDHHLHVESPVTARTAAVALGRLSAMEL